jgi:hypothetical protein
MLDDASLLVVGLFQEEAVVLDLSGQGRDRNAAESMNGKQ